MKMLNLHTKSLGCGFFKESFQVELSGSLRLPTGRWTGGPITDPGKEERCGAFAGTRSTVCSSNRQIPDHQHGCSSTWFQNIYS